MRKSSFFGDQTVLPADLNNIADSYGDEIKKSRQAPLGTAGGITISGSGSGYEVVAGGVFGSVTERLLSKNLSVFETAGGMQIFPGKCMPSDGEISELYTPITINIGQGEVTNVDGDKATWTDTTDGTYYVKATYELVEDEIKTDDGGTEHPTRAYGIMSIIINQVVPTTGDVLLATFDIAALVITNFKDARTYVRTFSTADAISIDPITTPFAGEETVDDHIKAVGTGTPAANNPHGLTAADIGVTISDEGTDHRKYEHLSGVSLYADSVAAKESYLVWYNGGLIKFKVPTDAFLLSGGSKLVDPIASLNPVVISDDTGDGLYYIIVDSVGDSSAILQSSISLDTYYGNVGRGGTYTILAGLNIDNNGTLVDSIVDMRTFHSYHPLDIHADFLEAESADLSTLLLSDTLINNLNRMRRQISKALRGVSGSWSGDSMMFGGSMLGVDVHYHEASKNDIFYVNHSSGGIDNTKYYGFVVKSSASTNPGLLYDPVGVAWYAAADSPANYLVSNGPPTLADFYAAIVTATGVVATTVTADNLYTIDSKSGNNKRTRYRSHASIYMTGHIDGIDVTPGTTSMELLTLYSPPLGSSGNDRDIFSGAALGSGIYNWYELSGTDFVGNKFWVPTAGMYRLTIAIPMKSGDTLTSNPNITINLMEDPGTPTPKRSFYARPAEKGATAYETITISEILYLDNTQSSADYLYFEIIHNTNLQTLTGTFSLELIDSDLS